MCERYMKCRGWDCRGAKRAKICKYALTRLTKWLTVAASAPNYKGGSMGESEGRQLLAGWAVR